MYFYFHLSNNVIDLLTLVVSHVSILVARRITKLVICP